MTMQLLKANGKVVDRSTVQGLTPTELVDVEHCQQRDAFLKKIHKKWGAKTLAADCGPEVLNLIPDPNNHNPWEDDDGLSFPDLDNELVAAEAAGDYYVNAEVLLPVGNSEERARVIGRKRDRDGHPIGDVHHNPLLDTSLYSTVS